MTRSHLTLNDADLADLDVAGLLRDGLPHDPRVFADGAIAAAIALDRLGIAPRSLTFLAEIVRRGGVDYAAELTEPLPTPEATELAKAWLQAATEVQWRDNFEGGNIMARWLDAVALLVNARQSRSS
jgi:hypothetical protein